MPTRIVLNTNPVPSQLSPRRPNQFPHVQLNRARDSNEGMPWSFDDGGSTSSRPGQQHPNHNETSEQQQQGQNRSNNALRPSPNGGGGMFFRKRPSNQNGGMPSSKTMATATTSAPFTSPSRRTSGFRSSILRELSVRQDSPAVSPARDTATTNNNNGGGENNDPPPSSSFADRHRSLSGADIRASPRFLGYLFSAIAGSVLLVSALQFFEKEVLTGEDRDEFFNTSTTLPDDARDRFFATNEGDLIYQWKLWGAIYASAGLVGVCFLIMLVHYDTVFLPKLWVTIFRDGSSGERNLTLCLIVMWMGALHICTSSLSVGTVQANVYFTSWIAFGSICLTYGVWRESAGLPTLMDMMNQHKRETTYNWFWIMIFSIVFAGAATDLYNNRNEIDERFEGEIGYLQTGRWLWVTAVFWFEVLNCMVAIILNDLSTEPRKLPCTCTRASGTYRCVFGWRQMEGFVMIAWIAAKFWVIWEYTGVDGVINGLSNAYFGIWGSFFNSVFALGTWLRENRNLEYLVRDDPPGS